MKNPIFWLAFAGLSFVATYALLHPSPQVFDALKDLALGILMGKFALAAPNGDPPK